MAIVKQGQNFWDLVIQETGSIENAFEMSLLNGKSATDMLEIGEDIEGTKITSKKIVDQFNEKHWPATGEAFPTTGVNSPNIGGIGYMELESTFIVS